MNHTITSPRRPWSSIARSDLSRYAGKTGFGPNVRLVTLFRQLRQSPHSALRGSAGYQFDIGPAMHAFKVCGQTRPALS